MLFDEVRQQTGLSKAQLLHIVGVDDPSDAELSFHLELIAGEYENWSLEIKEIADSCVQLTLSEIAELLGMNLITLKLHWAKHSTDDLVVGYGDMLQLYVKPEFVHKLFDLNERAFQNPKARSGILALPFMRWLNLEPQERDSFFLEQEIKLSTSPNRIITPQWIRRKEQVSV